MAGSHNYNLSCCSISINPNSHSYSQRMATQYRPNLSRAPMSHPLYISVSAHNLGQHKIELPFPHYQSPFVAPPLMVAPTRTTSISSGFLTPPSVDSSPRARHPLADAQEYFNSPIAPSKQDIGSRALSPGDVTPRPISPLTGSNAFTDRQEIQLSPIGSVISILSEQPPIDESLDLTSKPRRSSFSELEISGAKSTLAKRTASRAHKRQKWLNPHFYAAHEPWNRRNWRMPRCQMAPTAANGYRELCVRRVTLDIPTLNLVLSNQDVGGKLIRGADVQGSSDLLSRRWSSVELGTHRVWEAFARAPPAAKTNSTIKLSAHSRRYAKTVSKSTIAGDDFADAIRERLMSRKVAAPASPAPSNINLEHKDNKSNLFINTALSQPCIEYVVTGDEIDSIAKAIKSTLQQGSFTSTNISSPPFRKSLVPKNCRVMSFTRQGLVPLAGIPINTTLTPEDAYRFSEKLMEVASKFHFPPNSRKNSKTQKDLRKSKHEIIWTAGEPEKHADSSFKLQLTEVDPSPPPPREERYLKPMNVLRQHSPAFDPNDATASIHQWSWNLPTTQPLARSIWSDPDSLDRSPELQLRPGIGRSQSHRNEPRFHKDPYRLQSLKGHRSDTNMGNGFVLENVVSFPPLPRKMTCDWITPLPEMEYTPPSAGTRLSSASTNPGHFAETGSTTRCLYDQGIDATVCTGRFDKVSPSSTTASLQDSISGSINLRTLCDTRANASTTEEYRTTNDKTQSIRIGPHPPKGRATAPKIMFDPQYEVRRNKSVVQSHIKALPRTGDQSAIGSSIGSSSRRKKSTHVVLRDNSLKSTPESTTWSKFRADSAYPRNISQTSGELAVDEDDDKSMDDDRVATPKPYREALPHTQYAPLPTRDHVGIYNAMTGARAKSLISSCIEPGCEQPGDYTGGHSRNPSVDWIG